MELSMYDPQMEALDSNLWKYIFEFGAPTYIGLLKGHSTAHHKDCLLQFLIQSSLFEDCSVTANVSFYVNINSKPGCAKLVLDL